MCDMLVGPSAWKAQDVFHTQHENQNGKHIEMGKQQLQIALMVVFSRLFLVMMQDWAIYISSYSLPLSIYLSVCALFYRADDGRNWRKKIEQHTNSK